MRVISATTFFPKRVPMSLSAVASFSASFTVFINAPEPNFTSSTSALMPSANFFDMMLPQISGRESTVPVTSRRA